MAGEQALTSELNAAGFEKSEIGSSDRVRMFWSNLEPLEFKLEQNGELFDCVVPQSIVVEVAPSRHHGVYLFTPTLMLNRSPLSDDLCPTTKRLEVAEFLEWVNYLKTLFIIESLRRGYGREFDSQPDRGSEEERNNELERSGGVRFT